MKNLTMVMLCFGLISGLTAQQNPGSPSSAQRDASVEAYKPDGSLQCGEGAPISPEQACKELSDSGIAVLRSYKSTDGKVHPDVCGAATGIVNVCSISSQDADKAKGKGFEIRSLKRSSKKG